MELLDMKKKNLFDISDFLKMFINMHWPTRLAR